MRIKLKGSEDTGLFEVTAFVVFAVTLFIIQIAVYIGVLTFVVWTVMKILGIG